MPNKPNTDSLSSEARDTCMIMAVDIMKAQKYGADTSASPAATLGGLYEKLKEIAVDVQAGG